MYKWLKNTADIAKIIFLGILAIAFFILIRSIHVGDFLKISGIENILYGLFIIYIIGIALFIVLDNNNPNKVISWLIFLYAFPIVGFIGYLIFGRSFKKEKIARLKKTYMNSHLIHRANVQFAFIPTSYPFKDSLVNRKLANLLISNAQTPIFAENEIEIFSEGVSFYNRLLLDIKSAKHHIHLEYFIIKNDNIGNRLKEALIEKAKTGVEVRLIYDSVGSWRLGKKYKADLSAGGVEHYPFLPILIPILGRELNYRTHRKITVIDGKVAYIGGMNIGDEYMGLNPNLGYWRDTHMRIKGDSVNAIQNYFLIDWAFVSNIDLDEKKYYVDQNISARSLVQIAASGPDTDWEVVLQAYFTIITNAESRIWITSPYLVPEDSILQALKTAALSGVDVRILIPSKPDHFMVFWASRANLKPLLKAGVKIYLYTNGFVHSKIMIADNAVASVGTANLDIRSLEINFEINGFLYDEVLIKRLTQDYENDLKVSTHLTLEDFNNRPWWHRIFEAIGRIVSPLQ